MGRVLPRHGRCGRPLNSAVRRHQTVTSSTALPQFKYHPDPIKSKVLAPSTGICTCCNLQREWEYVGPIYGLRRPKHLCPWCIASGAAASRFDVELGLREALEPGASPESQEELICRTPWYFIAQLEPWPVHCGDYCAVVGRPSWEELVQLRSELEADVEHMGNRLELDAETLELELKKCPSGLLWTQLFCCLQCGVHRLNGDYE